jgi:hypothetical protein
MYNTQITLGKIEDFLSRNNLEIDNKDLVFKRCFNEAWFSNTLAWLLDPEGSHNLKAQFAMKFLEKIARIRADGAKKKEYNIKVSQLAWRKKKQRRSALDFRLNNASVIREFYLTKSIRKRNGRKPKFCDIVFFDLDLSDSLFLVIENKLFSSNYPLQLEEYYDTVEEKFRKVQVREYVYLTINGSEPSVHKKGIIRKYKYWVRMSWKEDILDILNELEDQTKHEKVKELREILEWLKKLCDKSILNDIEKLRNLILESVSECLCEELIRLNVGKRGKWEIEDQKNRHVTIAHSSFSKTKLYVELLPNLSITVQGRNRKKAKFDKVLIPYGTNSDQIYNLLDLAAGKVYRYKGNGNKKLYRNDNRRRKTLSYKKNRHREIFDFVYKNRSELQILFTLSDSIQMA